MYVLVHVVYPGDICGMGWPASGIPSAFSNDEQGCLDFKSRQHMPAQDAGIQPV